MKVSCTTPRAAPEVAGACVGLNSLSDFIYRWCFWAGPSIERFVDFHVHHVLLHALQSGWTPPPPLVPPTGVTGIEIPITSIISGQLEVNCR